MLCIILCDLHLAWQGRVTTTVQSVGVQSSPPHSPCLSHHHTIDDIMVRKQPLRKAADGEVVIPPHPLYGNGEMEGRKEEI